MEELVRVLEECISRIDEMQRRIELAPQRMRRQLHWVYSELSELRNVVVKARMLARSCACS